MSKNKRNYAYIDGSFNPETRVYGCGGYLIDQHGKKHIIQAKGTDPQMAKMRNVAGEILGAMTAVTMAKRLLMQELTIYHDYIGIEKWVTGEWKANKPATKQYWSWMKRAQNIGLKLYFKHVKGHSGDAGNDEADQLAKLAVGLLKEVMK